MNSCKCCIAFLPVVYNPVIADTGFYTSVSLVPPSTSRCTVTPMYCTCLSSHLLKADDLPFSMNVYSLCVCVCV